MLLNPSTIVIIENNIATVSENDSIFQTDVTNTEIAIINMLKLLNTENAIILKRLIEDYGSDKYSEGYDNANDEL